MHGRKESEILRKFRGRLGRITATQDMVRKHYCGPARTTTICCRTAAFRFSFSALTPYRLHGTTPAEPPLWHQTAISDTCTQARLLRHRRAQPATSASCSCRSRGESMPRRQGEDGTSSMRAIMAGVANTFKSPLPMSAAVFWPWTHAVVASPRMPCREQFRQLRLRPTLSG
jgi:hypothetical protein